MYKIYFLEKSYTLKILYIKNYIKIKFFKEKKWIIIYKQNKEHMFIVYINLTILNDYLKIYHI